MKAKIIGNLVCMLVITTLIASGFSGASTTKEENKICQIIDAPYNGPYITYYEIQNTELSDNYKDVMIKGCGSSTLNYWFGFYWKKSNEEARWYWDGTNYEKGSCQTKVFSYDRRSYDYTVDIQLKLVDDQGNQCTPQSKSVTIPKYEEPPPPTCFPAGTKITMADGSYKNIENIKPGNRILSYNISSGKSSSWTVSYIPLEPIKPVYEINNGLLKLSEEHPLYIKKANGKTGWGTLIPNKSFVQLKGEGLTLEQGDQLFTSNKEWIKVTNITYNPEPVQVYNIWSLSGTQNFFANNILVFEEHGTLSSRLHWYFETFLDRFPNVFPLLRHLIGD